MIDSGKLNLVATLVFALLLVPFALVLMYMLLVPRETPEPERTERTLELFELPKVSVPTTDVAETGCTMSRDETDLMMLEPAAMMGTLTEEQMWCVESWIALAPPIEQDRMSRILMANSWSKGDKKTWEVLALRHFQQIDDTDPDILYKYALYLSKKGPGSAEASHEYADRALENSTRWSGDTYMSRVYNLHKLRAAASLKLWQQRPHDDFLRQDTAEDAEEWLAFAIAAGKSTDKPLALCISADGDC